MRKTKYAELKDIIYIKKKPGLWLTGYIIDGSNKEYHCDKTNLFVVARIIYFNI